MTWAAIAAAVIGAGAGAVENNQSRQAARGAQGRILTPAQQNYNDRLPFRQSALDALGGGSGFDWSTLFDPNNFKETPVAFGEGQQLGAANTATQRAFGNVQNIDRTKAVTEALANFDKLSAPQLDAQYRGARQAAAAGGSLGSGRLTTSIGDYLQQNVNTRQALEDQTISGAEQAEVGDRFNQLGAAEENQKNQYGMANDAYTRATNAQQRQTALSQMGVNQQLQLGGMNQSQMASQLQRILGLAGLGFGNDPSNAGAQAGQLGLGLGAQANQQNGANSQAIAQIIRYIMSHQGSGGGGGASHGGGSGNSGGAYIPP